MVNSPNKIWKRELPKQLAEVVAEIDDPKTMRSFLRDVMTETEITEIAARLEAAKMLEEGSKYTEIFDRTNLSSRTIARISQWLKADSGGYSAAIEIARNYSKYK